MIEVIYSNLIQVSNSIQLDTSFELSRMIKFVEDHNPQHDSMQCILHISYMVFRVAVYSSHNYLINYEWNILLNDEELSPECGISFNACTLLANYIE